MSDCSKKKKCCYHAGQFNPCLSGKLVLFLLLPNGAYLSIKLNIHRHTKLPLRRKDVFCLGRWILQPWSYLNEFKSPNHLKESSTQNSSSHLFSCTTKSNTNPHFKKERVYLEEWNMIYWIREVNIFGD